MSKRKMGKMIKYFLLLIILIVCLLGCFTNNKRYFKKEYYPSGNLKSYGSYVQDSIPVDTLFTLYENGSLLSLEIYDRIGNTLKVFSYFQNGKIHKNINYKRGLANGFFYVFTETGNLKQKSFYFDDSQVGDTYIYDKNGKLERYGFFVENSLPLTTHFRFELTRKSLDNQSFSWSAPTELGWST